MRNYTEQNARVARIKAAVAMAYGDVAQLTLNGRIVPLPDVSGAIMVQTEAASSNLLTTGYASLGTTSKAMLGETSLVDGGYLYVLRENVGSGSAFVVRTPVRTDSASTGEALSGMMSVSTSSNQKGCLLKTTALNGSNPIGIVAYCENTGGDGTVRAFDMVTMAWLGSAVALSGLANTGFGLAAVTRSGSPHFIVASLSSGFQYNAAKCFPVSASGVGTLAWTHTNSVTNTDPESCSSIIVSPDGTKVAIFAHSVVRVLNVSDGTIVGSEVSVPTNIASAGQLKISQADGAAVFGFTSSELRRAKVTWTSPALSFSGSILSSAYNVREVGVCWHYSATLNKVFVACGKAGVVNIHELSGTDLSLLKTTAYTPPSSIAVTNAYPLHIFVDETDGIIHLIYTGLNATVSSTRGTIFDVGSYTVLREGSEIHAVAAETTSGRVNNGFQAIARHPIGGVSYASTRTIAGTLSTSPRHITPVARNPYGVCMKAASAGSVMHILRSGRHPLSAANLQTGYNSYDGTVSNPTGGVKMVISNGVAVI